MGFFDSVKNIAGDVGDTIKKGSKTASDNAKKLAEKAKLKREINGFESEIEKTYIEIGKKYFETIRNNPSAEYMTEVDTIIKNQQSIEDAKRMLAALDDKLNCPNCGAPLLKEQKFCDKCGTKIDDASSAESVETEVIIENDSDKQF